MADDLKALRDAVEALPADVTAALRGVAERSAHRVQTRAREILRSQLKTDAHALIDGIVIIEDAEKKQFIVDSTRPAGQPTNLPLWVEYGTSKMGARPYMRPAGEAENERYKHDSIAAASAVVEKLGTI